MSQSLIVFDASGVVRYQYNNKTNPFNDFIYAIANDTVLYHDSNFISFKSNQRKFYSIKRDKLYTALYFEVVTTIDQEKIRQTLNDVLKTYLKLTENDEDSSKLKKLIDYQFNQLMQYKQQAKAVDNPSSASPINSGTSTPKKTHVTNSKKKMRKWDNGEMVEDGVDESILDYSESKEGSVGPSDNTQQLKVDLSSFSHQDDLILVNELNDILDDSEDDETTQDGSSKSKGVSSFFNKLSSYFGSTVDIQEITKKFQDQLVSKNIHPATSKLILERINNKFGNKTQVTPKEYKDVLVEELTKILTPNVSTDLLYDIKGRNNQRPYVISVVGVNGVGKSTNLAKLAYWFLQNNLNVLICACDTFRSGAVEQLKVHVNNLKTLNNSTSKIDIFEKGYGGGDHVVTTAKLAINHAQQESYDIVLIDTAGRTHSNAKLMTPLKKFGDAANPDKIIMVGEALVGTDSIDQAINFNNAFGNRRNLDFFIISKVDTVGDLVGTMINMVMATKVPILFMGTGQTYTDIKRLNIKRIVDMLTN